MANEPRCRCAMFQDKGICYHTGYKPTFGESVLTQVNRGVRNAIAKDKKEREDSIKPQ